ncbi:hypothetical protein AGOR_G00195090 [Albula goreensis]|uniref:Ig-like domain-containing protein n=1 Tax=Albula goreensis TaxID=1534307 RepID=A0A8T3CX39_9TELE|nr:hypothetical protein AGOR_G00195090 [Albula goreensis]
MRHTAVFLGLLWVSGVSGSMDCPEVKELKHTVGGTASFQAGVKTAGYLYKGNTTKIAKVMLNTLHIMDQTFSGRLQWDSSTGFFSITGLKMEDSGRYKVQSSDEQKKDTFYQLTVYNPVSTPQVSSRNKMKPTCSVLCSVENGESPDLNTPLSLPLEIEENSAPYSCVATNPDSNKTFTVKPEEFCFGIGSCDCQVSGVQTRFTTPLGSARHKDTRTSVSLTDSVSKPRITSTAVEGYQGRYCSLVCSVENGREVTLSWQREGETLYLTSSPDLNTPLSLLLKRDDSNITYSCVGRDSPQQHETGDISIPFVSGFGAGIAVSFIPLLGILYLKKRSSTPGSKDLTYADINHGARRTQRGNGQMDHTGVDDEVMYSDISHKRPKKKETPACRVTQEDPSCVYAGIRT